MSSKPKAELEQALNSYLSNRSAENIAASTNSTRKIVDLVRGGVSMPGSSSVSEGQTTSSEEPEWMETLRSLAEGCDPQPVENSGRVVNQLTKVSELIPGLVDQLATLANQNRMVSQPSVVNHSSPAEQNESKPTPKDETLFRSRKDRRLKGIRISAEKLEKYELWCMINKVSFQDAVEKALDWLTSGQPVNHVLIDDQDDDEEKDIGKSISSSVTEQIGSFYCQWTRNSISDEDHRAMAEIAQIDLNAIKLGILIAIRRKASTRKKTTKINSFRYFLNSIREVARSHLGKSVSERMLQHTIQEIFKMNPEARQSVFQDRLSLSFTRVSGEPASQITQCGQCRACG